MLCFTSAKAKSRPRPHFIPWSIQTMANGSRRRAFFNGPATRRASKRPRVGPSTLSKKNITTGTPASRRSWRRAAERGYARFLSKRERAKAPALHNVERLEHSGHQNRLHHLCILQNPLKQEAKSQADAQHHLAM